MESNELETGIGMTAERQRFVSTEASDDPRVARTGGGIAPDHAAAESVLRVAQQETMAISTLADQKANILFGVSLIMITAVVGILPSVGFTIALMVLGASTVTSALLALVCLYPSTGKKVRGTNPLYFADVARMDLDEFRQRMLDILATGPSIYDTIIVDLHQVSTILLRHKFRYIRLAYGVLIVGLILTVVGVAIDIAVGNI